MSKRNKNKKNRTERRKNEMLKLQQNADVVDNAQKKKTNTVSDKNTNIEKTSKSKNKKNVAENKTHDSLIKRDLLKTIILSTIAFTIIILVWLFGERFVQF